MPTILHLARNAPSLYGNNAETIDNLHYQYDGNRLISVHDESGNKIDYEGGQNSISYDSSGNMISMPDKAIEEIVYNHLNLANSIKSNGNRKIVRYLYSADGTKLRKQFAVTADDGQIYGALTDYINGFYYSSSDKSDEIWKAFQEAGGQAYAPEAFLEFLNENSFSNVLKFIPTSEGFYDFENNKYIYQYKDHLGNVRLSFLKNANGEKEIVDQNDYYPFGLNHIRPDDPSYFGFGRYTNFKYSGKELQETGMYDFGWRQYMPDLGRWNGMDQLSEMYHDNSPYNFVGNNPVMFIDPDGRCIKRPEGELCPESPGGSQNPAPIEEVWVGTQPKSISSSSSSPGYFFRASFLSYALEASFSTGGTGGSGGGGGGGTPIDPWVEYRKDLADYRLAQSRRTLYSVISDPIDDVQTMFGIFGNVPVAGEIFDGINGLIYLGRGQKVNAIGSFAAIVPFAGGALKYGVKGLAPKILKYEKLADNFGTRAYIKEFNKTSSINTRILFNDITQGGIKKIINTKNGKIIHATMPDGSTIQLRNFSTKSGTGNHTTIQFIGLQDKWKFNY